MISFLNYPDNIKGSRFAMNLDSNSFSWKIQQISLNKKNVAFIDRQNSTATLIAIESAQ